jgi:SAM-dependent methyltransferase
MDHEMPLKPACYGEQYASAFQEQGVAIAYQHRPPYSPEAFAILTNLIVDAPRNTLDIGCGTGFIARNLMEHADHVDALDVSQAMIDQGRRLPNGDHARLRWIVGRAEDAPLDPPYALITAGDSLHWMEWDVVMPRFAHLLAIRGSLAILQVGQLPLPWDAKLLLLIQKYSVYGQHYHSIDLPAELERRGLFHKHGALQTTPVPFSQSLDAYVESFHGRASLARGRIGEAAAAAFDSELRNLVSMHGSNQIELQIVNDIVWGSPLDPAATNINEPATS